MSSPAGTIECPMCHGYGLKCKFCNGKGWVSELKKFPQTPARSE